MSLHKVKLCSSLLQLWEKKLVMSKAVDYGVKQEHSHLMPQQKSQPVSQFQPQLKPVIQQRAAPVHQQPGV